MARDESAQRLWNASLGRLQIQVARPTFDTWLRDTVALSLEDRHLLVGVPTTFGAEWLEKRMYQLVERAVSTVAHEPIDVSFQVQQPHSPSFPQPSPTPPANGSTPGGNGGNGHTPPSSTANHRYTFESFVVGSSNQLAHAAALAVADRPGHAYNPLFLYGGVGLGKTHLLHAIAQRVSARGGAARYVSTEQFTNDFISSIKDRRTVDFREKYRSSDVLLIDDIQFLCGKEQTQEGFFHTFNALHNDGRQIVIACDRHPKVLSLLEERLCSRFEGGLIADVQAPDLETRQAILQFRAKQLPVPVPNEALDLIAHHAQGSVREMEGVLNRVAAMAELTGSPVTLELVSRTLGPTTRKRPASPPPPQKVIAAVAAFYDVPAEAVCSSRRDHPVALARQVAAYLLREDFHFSLAEAGTLLGGKNHATILYSVRKVARASAGEPHLSAAIHSIRSSLGLN